MIYESCLLLKKWNGSIFLVVLLLFAIDLFFPVSLRIVEECPRWTQTNKDEIFMAAGLLTGACGILLAFLITKASMRYSARSNRDLSLQVYWKPAGICRVWVKIPGSCLPAVEWSTAGASWGYRLLPPRVLRIENQKFMVKDRFKVCLSIGLDSAGVHFYKISL